MYMYIVYNQKAVSYFKSNYCIVHVHVHIHVGCRLFTYFIKRKCFEKLILITPKVSNGGQVQTLLVIHGQLLPVQLLLVNQSLYLFHQDMPIDISQ